MMPAWTSKLKKRMKTAMKTYKFESLDPVTILSFLEQLKTACYSNEVSEGVAMWLLYHFMAKSSAASLATWMTPSMDTANCQLSTSATDHLVSKAAAETETFKRRPGRTPVIFAKVCNDKTLRSEDAFYEQRIESILVAEIPLKVHGSMRIYWAAGQTMHLRYLARYADILIQLGGNTHFSSTKSALATRAR